MDNILPTFQTFSLDDNEEHIRKSNKINKLYHWDPKSSIVTSKNRVNVESIVNKKKEEEARRKEAEKELLPRLPPNQKYYTRLDSIGPSPLSKAERGEAPVLERGLILPHHGSIKEGEPREKKPKHLSINIFSDLSTDTELYFQAVSNVSSITLLSKAGEIRTVSGAPAVNKPLTNEIELYLAVSRQIYVTLSTRQEIQDFQFYPGPIGIEVEMNNANKLSCARVFEGSQAAYYAMSLRGAEIVAVNGVRVVNLPEFERELKKGQTNKNGFNVITAATYRGGRIKLDDLYSDEFKRSKKVISSLLSKVFEGSEDEHQHDIVLPTLLAGSESDSVADNSVESKDNSTSQPMSSSVQESTGTSRGGGTEYIPTPPPPPVESPATSRRQRSASNDSSTNASRKNSVFGEEKGNGSGSESNSPASVRGKRLVESPNSKARRISLAGSQGRGMNRAESDDDVLLAPVKPTNSSKLLKTKKVAEVMLNFNFAEGDTEDEGNTIHSSSNQTETTSTWEYSTALENADLSSFKALVCVPETLSGSKNGWGNPDPNNAMLFVNFSENWQIDLLWADEDGYLVPRAKLLNGDSHSELLSQDHVWCIMVTRIIRQNNKDGHNWALTGVLAEKRNEVNHFTEQSSDVVGKSSVSVLLKPPAASGYPMALSLTWIPWVSMSFAEFAHALSPAGGQVAPLIKFQIFDNFTKAKVHHPNRPKT